MNEGLLLNMFIWSLSVIVGACFCVALFMLYLKLNPALLMLI
jgi:hypothetical protein